MICRILLQYCSISPELSRLSLIADHRCICAGIDKNFLGLKGSSTALGMTRFFRVYSWLVILSLKIGFNLWLKSRCPQRFRWLSHNAPHKGETLQVHWSNQWLTCFSVRTASGSGGRFRRGCGCR